MLKIKVGFEKLKKEVGNNTGRANHHLSERKRAPSTISPTLGCTHTTLFFLVRNREKEK